MPTRRTTFLLLLLLTSPLHAQTETQPTLALLLPDDTFQPLLRALRTRLTNAK